ncbi:MAG: hypothetical protein WC347_12105, partial [Smithellaceae bacterium]
NAARINSHDIFAFTDQICSGKAAFRDDMHHKKPLLVLAGRVIKWPEKIKNCGVLQGVGEKKYSGELKKLKRWIKISRWREHAGSQGTF